MESNIIPIANINQSNLVEITYNKEVENVEKETISLNQEIDKLRRCIISLENENEELNSKIKNKTSDKNPKNEEISSETCQKYEGNNIEDFLSKNSSIIKEQMNGGYKIFCLVCHEDGIKGTYSNSFENGVEVNLEDYELLSKGKNAKWHNLKKKLIKHLKQHETVSNSLETQRNLFMTALTIIKMKGESVHFEQLTALLNVLGVNLGTGCHTKLSFNNMLSTFKMYINNKISLYLRTPIATTGLKPHFAVALVKSSLNGVTNQATLALINADYRIAIPVICSTVPSDKIDLKAQNPVFHVNRCLETFLTALNLDRECLSQITAIYADGQYGDLSDKTFPFRIGHKYSDYFISLWDFVHWIDIEVKDVIDSTFLEAFIQKCSIFHNLFGIGKDRQEHTLSSSVFNIKSLETSSLNPNCFTSSFVKVLNWLSKSYPTLVTTFNCYARIQNEYDEIGYLLKSIDFPMDLCAAIDILSPISRVIDEAKSATFVPWSFISALKLILNILDRMQTNLVAVINDESHNLSTSFFPLLSNNYKDLQRKQSRIHCLGSSWVRDGSTSETWKVRNIKDCLNDYTNLCYQIHSKLKHRFEDNVGKHIVQYGLCFDMNQLLEDLINEAQFNWYKERDANNTSSFREIYSYLCKIPHLKDHLIVDSFIVYKNWKLCFEDLILHHSHHPIGNWFTDDKHNPVKLTSDIKSIRKEEEKDKKDNLLIQTYKLVLSDGNVISSVRFSESNMINFLLTDLDYFNSKDYPRELRIVLDFVFSTCGSETCVENFYAMIRNQYTEGESYESLAIRSAVDSTFPVASKCVNTCEDLARLHLCKRKSNKENTLNQSDVKMEDDLMNGLHEEFAVILNEKDVPGREIIQTGGEGEEELECSMFV